MDLNAIADVAGITVPILLGGLAGGVAAYYLDDALVTTLRKGKKWVVVAGALGGIGAVVFAQSVVSKVSKT